MDIIPCVIQYTLYLSLAVVNSATMNIEVHITSQISAFILSGYIHTIVELLAHIVVLFSVFFKKTPYCFP